MDSERRAAKASSELSETHDAFATVRADLIETWLATPIEATEYREHLFHAVKALDLVRGVLMSVVDTGVLDKKAAEVEELYRKRG